MFLKTKRTAAPGRRPYLFAMVGIGGIDGRTGWCTSETDPTFSCFTLTSGVMLCVTTFNWAPSTGTPYSGKLQKVNGAS